MHWSNYIFIIIGITWSICKYGEFLEWIERGGKNNAR